MARVIASANQKGGTGKTTTDEEVPLLQNNTAYNYFINTLNAKNTTGTQYGSLGYGKGYPKQSK